MRIAILGPIAVTDDRGRAIDVAGARLRALLVRLAIDAGRTVRIDALIEAVWADTPPAGATNALQTLVSRLRRALPAEVLIAEPTGYRITADVDIDEFDRLDRDGRAALDTASARERYEQALALWRGPALADVADASFARATIARLDEAKVATTEEWFAARLSAQSAGSLIGEIEEFAAAYPLRERPHTLLISALATVGRQADAARVYEELRHRLADELGLDPSPELAAAYTAMLRGERGGNLRPALTSFVGRDAELARLTAQIREQRLVTLVGPGGAGKTRLATEAARALAGEFAGNVWLVELAPVQEPEGIARALADALQLREIRFMDFSAGADALDRVLSALATKELLLVIDNCEHLIDASARLVDAVLGACPGVHVVTTSREPLAITGEALCPVGPLATPATDADACSAASVRLFVERAAAVRPGFALTETNTAAIAEICRRLDGMPLAIELACARLRTLPVDQIAARLDDRFRLLTGGSRTALARHQTLVAVVEWTWDLLSDAERSLATRFSVFLDGASIDTVIGVCGEDCVEPLAGLVDKSFVTLAEDNRYRMLETIRAYAAERLTEAGPDAAVGARDAHTAYFVAQAEHADQRLRGHEQIRWLRWMSDERDNLTGALRWAIDSGDAASAVRLAGALGWFWLLCDFHAEAVTWLDRALGMPGEVSDHARGLALAHYGANLMATGDAAKGEAALAQARDLGCSHPVVALAIVAGSLENIETVPARLHELFAHPDPWVRAMGTTVNAVVAIFGGHADVAETRLTRALAKFEKIGDYWARAMLHTLLGEVRGLRGDRTGAIAAFQASASFADRLGVPDVAAQMLVAMCLHKARIGDLAGARADLANACARAAGGVSPQLTIGLQAAEAEILRRGGEFTASIERYRRAIEAQTSLRGVPAEGSCGLITGLAFAELGLGHIEAAHRLGEEICVISLPSRSRMALSMACTVLAAVADARGDARAAAYLMGVGDGLRGLPDLGTPELSQIMTVSRSRLGDAIFDQEYGRGRATDLDSAIDELRPTNSNAQRGA